MKFLFITLMLSISLFGHASEWMYRTAPSLSMLSTQSWNVYPSGKNPIRREFQGYIEYKNTLHLNGNKEESALFLGKIGDADQTYINGIQVGQTGQFPPFFKYNMDTERTYYLPQDIIKNGQNEIRIVVYSKFLVNKGFDPNVFRIGSIGILDEQKYQNELFNNLSKFIIPILCLVLTVVSFPFLAPKHLWNSQLMIFLIGLSSFILGVCRGRVGYHFFEMLVVYKITLISSVITIWLVSVFMTRKCHSVIRLFPTSISTALITWILLSDTLVAAAGVGRIWFHISPLFLSLALFGNLKTNKLLSLKSVALISLIITNINDNLNDLRVIATTPLLQFGLGVFISLMIIDQLLSLKRSWEKYFMKEAQLGIDAELGRQALQIAHDLRSPVEAIREGLARISSIPDEEAKNLNLGISRINEICSSLLSQGSPTPSQVTYSKVVSELQDLIREIKSKNWNHRGLELRTYFEEFQNESGFNVDLGKLKRSVCNLVTNAIEAVEQSGTVSLTTSIVDNQLKISVQDNGKGIQANTEDLFSRGFTTKKHGNGLGLSSAKEYLESIGGVIHVGSLPRGTEVSLIIPQNVKMAPKSQSKMIVLIDDDPLVRFNWEKQGALASIEVLSFSTFEDFLQLKDSIQTTTPIFIDSRLGEFRGELLSKSLAEYGFRSVYLTTGLPKKDIITTQWISDVVCKGFDNAVLPKMHLG